MGIKPVFVFDGKPPEFKQETIEERRLARTKADEAWKAGPGRETWRRLTGRQAHHPGSTAMSSRRPMNSSTCSGSPGRRQARAMAQAAYMVQEGKVTYSVSQDYDSLLFGSPVLVRNLTVSGRRKIRGRTITVNPERIVLSALQKCLGVTREQLIEIGILVGTDFNPGIRGIGGKTALKIVRSGAFDSVIAEKQPEFDPDPPREFFLSPPVTDDYTLGWRAPDVEGVVEMLCGRYDFSEDRVRSALAKVSVKAAQKTLDAWF